MRPKPAWDHLSVWLPTIDWVDARQSMRNIAYPAEPVGSKALTHITMAPSATLYYIRRAYPPRHRAPLLVVNLLARAPACVWVCFSAIAEIVSHSLSQHNRA